MLVWSPDGLTHRLGGARRCPSREESPVRRCRRRRSDL